MNWCTSPGTWFNEPAQFGFHADFMQPSCRWFSREFLWRYTVDVCSDDRGRDPVMHMAPVHRQQLPSLRLANVTSGVRGRLGKKLVSFGSLPFLLGTYVFFFSSCLHGTNSQQQKAYALVLVMSCQLHELVRFLGRFMERKCWAHCLTISKAKHLFFNF